VGEAGPGLVEHSGGDSSEAEPVLKTKGEPAEMVVVVVVVVGGGNMTGLLPDQSQNFVQHNPNSFGLYMSVTLKFSVCM
jgi:hypothetical protein